MGQRSGEILPLATGPAISVPIIVLAPMLIPQLVAGIARLLGAYLAISGLVRLS